MHALRSRVPGLLLFVVGLACAAPAAVAEEPTTRFPVPADLEERDEWFGIYIQGTKCGYGHGASRRTTSDGPWVVTMEMRIDLRSFGQETTIESRSRKEFAAKAPHALVRASESTVQAEDTKTVELTLKDGAYVATINTAGETRQMTVDALDYTLADAMAPGLWMREDPDVGASIRVATFDVADLEKDVSRYTVLSETTSVAGGVPVRHRALKMVSESDAAEGVARVDDQGNVLSVTIGTFAELRLETEEVAKQIGISSDLFVVGLARIDKPVGDSVKVVDLVMEVRGDPDGALVDGPRQRVVRDAETGVVTISLGKAHGVTKKAGEKEIADALANTVDYPVEHPGVVALAKQAVGDAQTAREKVARLVEFVSEYVEDALTANSHTVEHIIAKKKGDCSEHALLFTALARAAGVPAREVTGFLYVGDEIRGFGGHAWNEVVLDGAWVEVDAAWNQTDVDATHVRLGGTDKGSAAMLATFGKLSFELRSVKHAD